MKCRVCQTHLEIGADYCTKCGNHIRYFDIPKDFQKEIKIGRSKDNDIVIAEPIISSHHARFIIKNGDVTIEDLKSTNGTYVNNKKILCSKVTSEDIIKFSNQYMFDWEELYKIIPDKGKYKSARPGGNDTHSWINFPVEQIDGKKLITIGRSSDNDIVIENIKASRRHAKLEYLNGVWFIEDLNSSNGTFLNGKKIKREKVLLSDVVIIGGVSLDLNSIFLEKKQEIANIELSAKNISFSVKGKTIVDDISLSIKAGEFVGLIGPAGAGKTTLMMMMNGVNKPSAGEVFINSQSLFRNLNSFKGQIGYVPQDDIIHRELKVNESFSYTARMRLTNSYSGTEIDAQVNNVIKTLDLTEARETLIGTPEKKGISGGQRKKVNLGQELLTEPSVLFLDEPTSGLDPKNDMNVMRILRNISKKGNIVVLTTHNITAKNFETLTHLVVLTKGGKLAYFGPADKATGYFEVEEPYQIYDKLSEKENNYWQEKYRNSKYYNEYIVARQNKRTEKGNMISEANNFERSFDLAQFFCLSERYMKIKLRDKMSSLILLFQAPIIAALISLVFSGPEQKTSALFVLVIAAIWFGCSNAAREIVSEQSIFKRERMVNLKIPSYIFSKIFILSFLCVIQSAIMAGIVHPSLNLLINPAELFLILVALSVTSLSIGLFVSSMVNTNEAAMGLIPIVLIPQVILGGLISPFGNMKDSVQILAGFMLSRWSFEAVLIREYKNNTQVITSLGFNPEHFGVDIVFFIAFNILFLGMTAYSLKQKDI